MKKYLLIIFILIENLSSGQVVKILFDATKAEMAGNADWIIDADVYNLGSNFNGAMVPGQGDDANPQRFPTPLQSNITSSTNEMFWDGSLSNWAIDMVKLGYEVETLPYYESITYGNSSHAQDLSNYKVFIVDEPNILFTTAEKTALINFVQNGGGLFIISDHDISDRNGDGYDSPNIWNDLFLNNSIHSNLFGITFDLQNFSQTSTNIANLPADSCLHGVMGNVTEVQFSNGTSMSLDVIANNTVRGLIYRNGASNSGNTQVLFARANYGNGRVCALGDSSPPDDGTGDPNDNLFYSYTGEANGCHQKLLVNAAVWLATDNVSTGIESIHNEDISINVFPNPSHGIATVQFRLEKKSDLSIEICDLSGRIIQRIENLKPEAGINSEKLFFPGAGFYMIRFITRAGIITRQVIID